MDMNAKNLNFIFNPKSIAIIGASQIEEKVGGVVLRNLVNGNYKGKIVPVNPKYNEIVGLKCYNTLSDFGPVECAIITTPSIVVPQIAEECGELGVRGIIVLSGGFGEVGNKNIELQLKKAVEKYGMALIGVNCLGILDTKIGVDSIFLPMHKLQRPPKGSVAFVTQSGAVGSSVIDMVAYYGVGVSKFISYGNATSLGEIDCLEFLEQDPETKQIILYIEGTRDGKRLYETMKRINQKKPIVVLKAGRGEKGSKAAFSHTGNLAGNYLAYKAAFRQAKVIEAEDLDELFDFIKIFNQPLPRRKEIGIITNGGGLGILATDAIEQNKLALAEFSSSTAARLKKIIPSYASVNNPLDVIADATPQLYEKAIEVMMEAKEIGAIVIIVLFQVPAMNEEIIQILEKASKDRRKPILVIGVGGGYVSKYRRELEKSNVPTYGSPMAGVAALKKFIEYSERSRKKTI